MILYNQEHSIIYNSDLQVVMLIITRTKEARRRFPSHAFPQAPADAMFLPMGFYVR